MENYKFKSLLLKKQQPLLNKLSFFRNLNLKEIEDQEKIDNTVPNLISAKLDIIKSKKLLIKNYDIIPKEKLFEFGIKKNLNNRESYFYFLEYISNVEILDDGNKIDKTKNIKVQINKENEPKVIINFADENMNISRKIEPKKINKSEDDEIIYEEILIKKIINIENFFILKEKINIQSFKKKINKYLEQLTLTNEYKNNNPAFQSDLYYHYQLENVLELFKELNDKKIQKK